MSRNRGRNTTPEMILRKALWANRLRYRKHYSLPGKPDIVFPGKKIAVFVDGCFWHKCPVHFKMPTTNTAFWRRKINRNVERDQRVTYELEESGWKVIRFWEHDVLKDTHRCVLEVTASLNQRA